MTSRRVRAGAVALVALVVLGACTSASDSSGPPTTELGTRKAKMGDLEVVVTPTRLNGNGAEFLVVFDTHTGAPPIDVASNATLSVAGTAWRRPTWSGDRSTDPSTHHRRGTLRFSATGPPRGTARLTITGLESPLDLTWQLTPKEAR